MPTNLLGSVLPSIAHHGRAAALIAGVLACHGVLAAAESPKAAAAAPACSTKIPRPGDELWIISSRGLGCERAEKAALRMKYWLYQGSRWTMSSRQEFLARPADLITSFFVIGNDYSHAETVSTAWRAYRNLARQFPNSPPLRFVAWSWPSDRLPGRRLNDAKIKLARTPAASYYIAWLVDQLPPDMSISMSGYSFGARIIMGSLELLAGGRVGRYRLASREERRPRKIDAVLIGAAFDNNDLLPGQPFGRSLSQAHQVLLFVNSSDRALRFYHYLYGRHHRHLKAAGLTGIASAHYLGAERHKIVTRDVTSQIGRRHGADLYFQSSSLLRTMHPFLFDPSAFKKSHR